MSYAEFLKQYEKEIELTFKIVITLASVSVVIALFRQVFNIVRRFVKKYLFYFADINERLTNLENKLKSKDEEKENGKE